MVFAHLDSMRISYGMRGYKPVVELTFGDWTLTEV